MERRIVLGGPGTGKTHALLKILDEELSKGVPASRIAYVSYTRQGAYHGAEIAKQKYDFTEEACKYFRTLHSLAFRALGVKNDEMMGSRDMRDFERQVNIDRIADYLKFDELRRNNARVAAKVFDDEALDAYTAQFVSVNYKAYKEQKGKRDFTDLLEEVVAQRIHLPVDVAIVDEAQDLTTLHWTAADSFFLNAQRIYYGGDPNQAIFDWAGADYEHFMQIQADDIKVLDHSYRLPKSIWMLGKQIHAQIDIKTPFPSSCKEEPGVLQQVTDVDCSKIRKGESYLFLARAKYSLEDIEAQLKMDGRLYIGEDGEYSFVKSKLLFVQAFFMYKWRRAFTSSAHKKALNKYFTDEELKELLDKDRVELTLLSRLNWPDVEYYVSIGINRHFNDNPELIRVSTMHKVKGAEADNVYVLLDATKKTTLRLQDNPDAELRVLYVAVTRAKKRLYIVSSKSAYSYPVEEIGKGVIQ